MFEFFIVSLLTAFGLAVTFSEKGNDFPIKRYRVILQKFIHDKIHWRLSHVFFCTVCLSFWTALATDIILFILYGHFLWPLSGFASLGLSWTMIELLNAIDGSNKDETSLLEGLSED